MTDKIREAFEALGILESVIEDHPNFEGYIKTIEEALQAAQRQGDIAEITEAHFQWVERMGWHNKSTLEALALIASEVGEAVNECRGERPTHEFPEELADIALRLFDLARSHHIDLATHCWRKIEKNEHRGTRGRVI